ncbi:hypothetical protein [ANMV-1 virus]|nr:hypothetical protein [ANMV-1 virus]
MHFLKGGNWDSGCTGFTKWEVQWEHEPLWIDYMEGLPDRWVSIIMGQTGWIPKIVFKSNAKKKVRILAHLFGTDLPNR